MSPSNFEKACLLSQERYKGLGVIKEIVTGEYNQNLHKDVEMIFKDREENGEGE